MKAVRVLPAAKGGEWLEHFYREHNTRADELANRLQGSWKFYECDNIIFVASDLPTRVTAGFDGHKSPNRTSSGGWVDIGGRRFFEFSIPINLRATIITAELTAALIIEALDRIRHSVDLHSAKQSLCAFFER